MLPEAAVPALTDYVSGGGALVAEARLGWNNERGYASDRIPGLGLWQVMGARESAIETAPREGAAIRWTSSDLPGLDKGQLLPGRWYKETLEPVSSQARVVAEFDDGSAAAVMSTYGKGRTLLLGSYVSAAAQSTPSADAERFFAALVGWAGATPPVVVTGSPVEARHLESGPATLLFLFNHDRVAARSVVTLRRPEGGYAATDLVSGLAVELKRTAEGVAVPVALPPSGVQVLETRAQVTHSRSRE